MANLSDLVGFALTVAITLLCTVVSVALNGEFERFGGFALTVAIRYSNSQQSIFSHTFLYISNINRHTACVGTL